MAQAVTILYEDSTPARNNTSFYNTLSANSGLEIRWLLQSSSTNGYEQLQSGEADAILISGREDFHELTKKGFEVLISKQHERRLVALFSASLDSLLLNKKNSEAYPLTVAADLVWQAQMAANFLARALPSRPVPYQFLSVGDDHEFDERLVALSDGRIDIAVVTLDALNQSGHINTGKLKHMVLPLFECPPNIYQATTGLITRAGSNFPRELIRLESDVKSIENFLAEASLLAENDSASYGVFRQKLPFCTFTYLARPELKKTVEAWKMDASLPAGKKLFSTTDFMKDFFEYGYPDVEKIPDKKISFIASHKSVHNEKITA